MQKIQLKTLEQTEMTCFFEEPHGQSARAAVIVLQEAFGVNEHIQNIVKSFAKQGYLAIAPELYHRTAPSGWTCGYTEFNLAGPHFSAIHEDGVIADVQTCYDWLKGRSIERVATIGFCLGGRASFLANSKVPLDAAISFYGGGISPKYLLLAERQIAPLLFFWGGKDKHILSDQIQDLKSALTLANRSFVNIEMADADHGFFCDQRPVFHRASADLAWATTLEFLKQNLTAK
jgi:carboxymethylenebutenolidase